MRLLAIMATVCALYLTACATAPQSSAPVGLLSLEEQFRWVAFHGDDGAARPLMRWEGPIRAVTVGASQRDRQKVEEHLSLLTDLTGLDVSVDHAAQAPAQLTTDHNMVVMFDDADGLYEVSRPIVAALGANLANPGHFTCAFMTGLSGPNRISGAVIAIRNDPIPGTIGERILRGCVAQEITQSLGLPGDLDNHVETIFSSHSVYIRPTAEDRKIIQILFDGRLIPGMTEAEAAPIIRRIIIDNDW